jgi:1-deoxy-D-xylulose-5-phosphate synthase
VKPIDVDLICSLTEKIPRIITVEENVRQGGFGSAVLECLNDEGITDFCLERIGIPDTFVEHGSQEFLRKKYRIDASAIVDAAKKMVEELRIEELRD